MTFASTIRFAASLLLAATLAGCAFPYDQEPYSVGNTYSAPYYSGFYYGGDAYTAYSSRRYRTHRRGRRDGDGALRRHRGTHERSGLEQRHRRDRAERLRERRRAAADRAGFRAGDRIGDRTGDRRHRERAAERPAAERRAWRAERRTHKRDRVPRRYDDHRGSDETDAAIPRRVDRAGRHSERARTPTARILAGGALPEK